MSDFAKNLWSASNLQLWKSHCDKKIEYENLQEQLTTITKQRDELREMLNKIASESTAVRATPRNTKAVRDQVELGGYIKHFKVETYLINQSVGLLNQLKDQSK